MAGFAAAIGGLGEAAGEHGRQIRSILEQRRAHFADLLTTTAAQESDPQRRAELLGHAADLHAGKDISKIAPALLKTAQDHDASNQALSQLFGGPPEGPKPKPGPAQPGSTPGTPQLAPGAAAQPATSPVAQPAPQPQISPITNYSPVNPPTPAALSPQAIPPVQTQAPQPSAIPSLDIQDPQAIMQKYMGNPMWQAPANRGAIQAAMTQELSHNEALRQAAQQTQIDIQAGLQKLGVMADDPRVQALTAKFKAQGVPDFMIPNMIGSALKIPVTPMTGMLSATFGQPIKEQIDVTQMGPEDKLAIGIPTDAAGKWTVERYRVGHGLIPGGAYQGWAGATTATSETGQQQRVSNNQQLGPNAIQSVAAPVVSSNVGRHQVTNNAGQLEFRTAPEINRGAFQNPQFAPVLSKSVQQVPGQLPTTTETVKQRGTGGAAPHTIPAVGGGGASATPAQSLEQRKYQDWADGKSTPTGRELTAVQSYAAQHSLPSPVALSAQGTKDLKDVADVLSQIQTVKKMFESFGMKDDDTRKYYSDYLAYRRGGTASPKQDLWTALSFESLRSAAAALKGTNSRALPIISRALEHTPDPSAHFSLTNGKLPDTPKKMYGQLLTMEKILEEGRNQVLENERKTGIPGVSGSTTGRTVNMKAPNGQITPVPADQVEHYKSRGAVVVQ